SSAATPGAPPKRAPTAGAAAARLAVRASRRRGGTRRGPHRWAPRARLRRRRVRDGTAHLAPGWQRAGLDRTEPRRGAPGGGPRSRRRARSAPLDAAGRVDGRSRLLGRTEARRRRTGDAGTTRGGYLVG